MTIHKGNLNSTGHIVFLGESTFPAGLAAIQRMTLMAKALIYDDFKVTVICRKGQLTGNNRLNIKTNGIFEGINYIYTSKNVYRPNGFIKRNIMKLKGMAGEYKFLATLKKNNDLSAAIISNHSALHLLRYKIYSLLIGFPIVLNFVEMASSMKGRDSVLTRLNDNIFDNHIVKIVDGALPISDVLMNYYRKLSPSKPALKLPILCDFNKFNIEKDSSDKVVFLYCGAISYLEIIEFVIDAFDKLENLDDTVKLQLILGGNDAGLELVRQKVEASHYKENIEIITNVPHKEIPNYYSNATALLIPLRPTMQDEARFPHKIGEYLASGQPMITSAFGEINNYNFIDGKNCFIAKEYDVDQFTEKMNYILKNQEESNDIGKRGRQMGLDNFEYSKFGKILRNYFELFN